MTSLIDDILRTGTRRGREASGRFALEGLRVVERALRAGAPVLRVGVDRSRDPNREPWLERVLALCAQRSIPPEPLEPDDLRRLVGGRDLGGVVALVELPELRTELDPPEAVWRGLVLDATHDPGNVGALVRTAHACDVRNVIAVGTADPFHPRAVRTSMGSLFRVRVVHAPTWQHALDQLQAHGIPSFATVAEDGEAIDAVVAPDRAAIWMGCEAHGLDDALVARCERRVSIPMPDDVDSLSINAAAAIVAFALRPRAVARR